MADKKISALTAATTPLAGTEVLPIVQGGATVKVSVANLTDGRAITASSAIISDNSANAALRITQVGAGNALLVEDSANPDATPFVVNASGNVGIGKSAPDVLLDVASSGNVVGRIKSGGTISALYMADTNTTADTCYIGTSGNDWRVVAGSGVRLTVGATGDITVGTGNLVIGTSGKGIDFSATPGTGTSELLADYEEGTWTVTYSTSGGNFSSITYAYQTGRYVKIGTYVFAYGQIGTTVTPTGGSGTVRISLPFTSTNAGIPPGSGKVAFNSSWTTNFPTHFVVVGNSAQANLVTTAASGQISDLGVASLGIGNFMEFSVFYQTTA